MTILQDYASWVQLAGGTGEAVSLSAGDCLMISQQTVQVLVIHYSLFLHNGLVLMPRFTHMISFM